MPRKKNRKVSIYVSGTFLDMQSERDALRYSVMPKVNEFAEKYGPCYSVEIIDLRWGINTANVSEEKQNEKVLRACLNEIDHCRPFFLGLIGDKYGFTPPREHIEDALKAAAVPFSPTDPDNMSITALEIEYGMLHPDGEPPPICLFYFRKSPDYSVMSKTTREIYLDNDENLTKLNKLKMKIRDNFGKDITEYDAKSIDNELFVDGRWPDMVAADIITKLRMEWGEPPKKSLNWKVDERYAQETFRESRTAHFAGRNTAIEFLEAFCLGERTTPQLLMIQGEIGSGKSGLLCKVMDKIEDKCLLLPFSCGISSRSSLVENMLRYFIFLLCEKLEVEDDSDTITKYQDLKDRFIELIWVAGNKKLQVVAVVDALDRLGGSDEARKMQWISGRLPENFRMLCSIIDGPEIDAIKQLDGKVQSIPPIGEKDIAWIIRSIAGRHHKEFPQKVVDCILEKRVGLEPDSPYYAAQNPLYVSLIAQLLAMMDSSDFDTVMKKYEKSYNDSLEKFMLKLITDTPGDPEGAYLAILKRLELTNDPIFVRGVCGLIAISRSGLRVDDLTGAFENVETLETKFNSANFSWLRQMLRDHFARGDMLQWDFAHQSLRRAIKKNWSVEELEQLNNGLIDYFRDILAKANDNFAAREIMHQLCWADRPDIAAEVIAEHYDRHGTALARGLADVYNEYAGGPEFLKKVPESAGKVDEAKRWIVAKCIREVLPLLPEDSRPFRLELMLAAIAIIENVEDVTTWRELSAGEETVADIYMEIGQTKKAGEYYERRFRLYGGNAIFRFPK
ncbi:hypothetical protein R80B4_02757 [Fibrobacteres bacterium R8-0-B4]